MIIKDRVRVVGRLSWILRGPDGRIKVKGHSHNIVTTLGDQEIAKAYKGDAPTLPTGMTLGTGVGAPAKGDTTLGTQIAASYEAFDGGYPSRTLAVITYMCTWVAGDVTENAISEAGIVNDATFPSAGVLAARGLLSPVVNKAAADSLEVTWTETILGA